MSKDSQIYGLTETLKAADAYIEALEHYIRFGGVGAARNVKQAEWRKRKSRYQWLREQAMPSGAEE